MFFNAVFCVGGGGGGGYLGPVGTAAEQISSFHLLQGSRALWIVFLCFINQLNERN